MSSAAALLQLARGELGQHEDPPGSNRTKYGTWYGIQDAWCGMFVSWCAAMSGASDVVPRYAYTPAGADWFQRRGAWSRQPLVGAIAFYDVSGMGRISHTGIVEQVLPDGRWYAIEGNTNGAGSRTGGEVRRQLRSTVGTSRGGFGYPRYTTAPTAGPPPYPGQLLRRGMRGTSVRQLQERLSAHLTYSGGQPIEIDGQFGPATENAVRWFQAARGLDRDGVVGPLTWTQLWS